MSKSLTLNVSVAVLLALALVAAVTPVSAQAFFLGGSSDVEADVDNKDTSVSNNVTTSASTGGNEANGGEGDADADAEGGDATAKAEGGWAVITTGDATAKSYVRNDVNNNTVSAKRDCGCVSNYGFGSNGDVDAEVDNKNTSVSNNVETKAKTGYNDANGGNADADADTDAGKKKSYHNFFFGGFGGWGNSNSGDAKADAIGGDAVITTGDAYAKSKVVNVVNTNVVRARR